MAENSNDAELQPKASLSEKTIQDFIRVQQTEIEADKERIALQKFQIEKHSQLALESIKHQADILKKAPVHRRKDRTQIAIFSTIVLLVVLGSLLYLVANNHERFANVIIDAIKYAITLIIGYLGGRAHHGLKRKGNNENPSQEDYIDYDEAK